MNLPIGEWLIFCLGLLALIQWETFRIEPYFKFLPLIWILGWVFQFFLAGTMVFQWNFPRIFVLVAFFILCWRRAESHEALPLFLTGAVLLGHNLLVVNEPGIYRFEPWLMGILVLLLAYTSTHSLWGMALAVTGGLLLNMGFSVFLFTGIVRRLDLPDPFFWHLCIAGLTAIAFLSQLKEVLVCKHNSLK